MLSALVPVLRRRPLAHAAILATVAGTVAVGVLAIRVGHAGGTLVYRHNAGSAYASAAASGGEALTGATPAARQPARQERGDDDDR